MTESEIQCLKENIGKMVELETKGGERLIAKVLFVTHSEEYDEHDLTYEMVRTTTPEFYATHKASGGFVLNFGDIISVRPFSEAEPDPAVAIKKS